MASTIAPVRAAVSSAAASVPEPDETVATGPVRSASGARAARDAASGRMGAASSGKPMAAKSVAGQAGIGQDRVADFQARTGQRPPHPDREHAGVAGGVVPAGGGPRGGGLADAAAQEEGPRRLHNSP